ncbi:MAG: hypothetical protein ACRDPO_26740 [Streptosporangiaceae bacterium]
MALPEVPGIIEAEVAITSEPDGRVSFRVVVGANSGQPSQCDLVELIINPEHVGRALAGMQLRATADMGDAHEPPTFPCHIGFSRSAVHTAASS